MAAAPRALQRPACRLLGARAGWAPPWPRMRMRRSFAAASGRCEPRRTWSTPLARQLFQAISTTGPVPLASYMRMCLTGDLGGYYSGAVARQGRDPFGPEGDFVTSPQVSQVFGELVAVWFVAEWISQGRPQHGVQLIELGPGRGTLMDDMLRTMQRFPPMAAAIDSVFMVEASPGLREAQKMLLCGPGSPSAESSPGYHSTGRRLGKPVVWTETIKSIPCQPDKVPFIVAHEFFDALPIHAFQSAAPGAAAPGAAPPGPAPPGADAGPRAMEWREMMVSPAPPAAGASSPDDTAPEFQLVLSPGTTRHSRYLPESSPRYRRLKQTPGALVEVCPDASLYAADLATRIGDSPQHPKARPSGAALILDYGTSDAVPANSLRAIRHHCLVSPFASPGLVDLSADVDFAAIAESATLASRGVEVHGPVAQADFLELMGIRERADMLAKGLDKGAAESLDKAWRRLVDRGPGGMGKVYKALAILPENDGRRRPAGFGGDVGA